MKNTILALIGLCLLPACLPMHVEQPVGNGEVVVTGDPHPISPYPNSMAGFDYIVGFADIDTSQTLDNPLNAGIRYRSRTNIEPLEVEMGFGFGYDHESGGLGAERRLRYYEVSLGAAISKRLGDEQRGILEPYAGAGVALLFGRGDVAEVGGWKDYTDTTSGLYAHAGLRVYMFKGQFIALDYRAMTGAELDLGLGDSDFDSTQVSVILGFSY